MYLEDTTGDFATLARSRLGEDRLAAAVHIAAAFDLHAHGSPPTLTRPVAHMRRLMETPFGARCSVTLSGALVPTDARATCQRLALELGDARRAIDWIGRRTWVRGAAGVVPGNPSALEPITLSPEVAFGGTYRMPAGEHDGLPVPGLIVPHPINPRGVGFHRDEATAVGGDLPRLEWSDERLARSGDAPRPAVLTPVIDAPAFAMPSPAAAGGEAAQHQRRDDEVTEALRLLHPCDRRMTFDAPPAATSLSLYGFVPGPRVERAIASPVRVTVDGPAGIEIPGSALSIHVDLDAASVVVLFRHSLSVRRGRRPTLLVWHA